MLPEWLWMIIVGGCLMGLLAYIWNTRNQGYLKSSEHIKICTDNRVQFCLDMDKMEENIRLLLNTKFENLDDKIENKVLKELRLISNGNNQGKPRVIRKKRRG